METNTTVAEKVNRHNPLDNTGYKTATAEAASTRSNADDADAAPAPTHDIWGGVNYYRIAKGRKMCSPSRIF